MTLKSRLQNRLALAPVEEAPLSVDLIDGWEARCKALGYDHADEMKKLYPELPVESLRTLAMAAHRNYFDAARAVLRSEQP
jgi:hypothetical protein